MSTQETLDTALERIKDLDESGPFPRRGEFVLRGELDDAITAYMDHLGLGRNQRSRVIRRLLRAGMLTEGRKALKSGGAA